MPTLNDPKASPELVTDLLAAWSAGDRQALDRLMPLVQEELHRLARRHLRGERPGHTLQTAALVNEAYLRLVGQRRAQWHNRAQFLAIAAQLMRRILIDHARKVAFAKRGGGAEKLPLDEACVVSGERAAELIALDDALAALAALDERKSQVVELRYFGGLTVEETAEALGVHSETVERDWQRARAFLRRELAAR